MGGSFHGSTTLEEQRMMSRISPGQFYFNWGRKLGEGGLGRVDEIIITDSNSTHVVGSRLACKRLNDRWKHEQRACARFEREIQALRQMSHPSIVSYEGENLSGSDERFYVMPLYEKSLRNLLATKPDGFNWPEVAKFVAQMAEALAYAHQQGFIHRDLKPENILLDAQHHPIIADWGLGYFVHKESKVLQNLTRGGMGTEYYCSMEQWATGKCDVTGDIYSLGLMLAELIHGHQFPITVGMGIQGDVIVGNSHGARMLNDIVRLMTDLHPGRRIQTMTEVAYHLRQAAALAAYAA
jgi:serine/threonine protein kinase